MMLKVSEIKNQTNAPLRLAVCGGCKSKQWLPSDVPAMCTTPCTKCGHPVILPTQIRQFELREIVASGGMGTVYRAFDTTLERLVAVKFLKREMADDKQVLDSFYREARVGASLNHTNIIHIYQFDEYDSQPFLVMELADNGSLDSRIEKDGYVSELLALDVGTKIVSALQTALKHNLLHRDIKPSNILFNDEGEPKLVDFGLARSAEEQDEYASSVWGTPYYVAPEKIERKGETFHSDMYSLGGTLYHALTGHVPFEAETIEQVVAGHVHTPLTPPNQVNINIGQETSDAIATAMAKNPEDRFPTYDDFGMALEAARSHYLVQRMRHEQAAHPELDRSPSKSWWQR